MVSAQTDVASNCYITSPETMQNLLETADPDLLGKKYKVQIEHYSKSKERRLIVDLNEIFMEKMNLFIEVSPFYNVLESGNNINTIIGITINVVSLSTFIILLVSIFVQTKRDFTRRKYMMGVLKTIGVSDHSIAFLFIAKYLIVFGLSIVLTYIAFAFVSSQLQTYVFSMFVTGDISLYAVGIAIDI